MRKAQPVTIVMIEDDEGHATLIQTNLRRANIGNDIRHFTNGQDAIDYLFSLGAHAGAEHPNPMLILLDLNVPEVDGFEILEKLRADERTQLTPIIVLTTTDNPQEVQRCYELGCNVYVTKPVEYSQFAESIHKLGLMLSIVKIPETV